MISSNIIQPDVRLLLDADGVIRDVLVFNDVAAEPVGEWVGRAWAETVAAEEAETAAHLISDASAHGASPFCRLVQCFPSGRLVPMEYTSVHLGGDAGLMVIGRDASTVAQLESRLAAAQRAMERDYWKLRQLETRYRAVLHTASDAVLMVRGDDFGIAEANDGAARIFGLASGGRDSLNGRELPALIPAAERAAVKTMLVQAREHGQAPGLMVHLGAGAAPWLVRAQATGPEQDNLLLVKLVAAAEDAAAEDPAAGAPGSGARVALGALLERSPDGYVVLDRRDTILYANAAFLDLVQVGALGALVGIGLERWLGNPGAGAGLLLKSLREHGTVRLFRTLVRGDLGTETEVEISGVADSDPGSGQVGLWLRDVSRRLDGTRRCASLESALGAMTEQLGTTLLKDLVASTVSLVERHYIEAALATSDGNRTAAARLLGLSRQSLYVKLARYGIDGETMREASIQS